MAIEPSVERIADLQQLIADLASVFRVPQLADKGRPENDVEHSYGLALTSWFLAGIIAPELDQLKIFKYALAHDVVELHAGDTFVFGDKAELDSKSYREDEAIDRLKKDWSDFSELSEYAQKYKDKYDEEAKFVYSLDKLLPVLMINLGEKSEMWHRHKITFDMQISEKKDKMRVSPYIAPYFEKLVEWMSKPDYFYKDESDAPETSQQM